jgi:HK97 family phage prohead protease
MTLRTSNPARIERNATAHYVSCALREIKAGADGEMTFTGYGAVFGNVDSYGDAIDKGAFKRTLREAKQSGNWPVMLSQHGAWGITASDLTPIGVYSDLDEDDKGLALKGVLAATPRGIEMHTLMAMKPRPAINGLSIGYIPRKWRTNAEPKPGEPRRVLTDVDLLEVSIVTWPANDRARVAGVKSFASARDLESAFRDVLGMSGREAKRAAGAAWRALGRDTEPKSELSTLLRASAAKFAQ